MPSKAIAKAVKLSLLFASMLARLYHPVTNSSNIATPIDNPLVSPLRYCLKLFCSSCLFSSQYFTNFSSCSVSIWQN